MKNEKCVMAAEGGTEHSTPINREQASNEEKKKQRARSDTPYRKSGMDLPNASEFRRKGGAERDDLKSAHIVTAMTEFASEVRRYDTWRPVFSGNSHPRPSACHNTHERNWKPDSREQSRLMRLRDNAACRQPSGPNRTVRFVSSSITGPAVSRAEIVVCFWPTMSVGGGATIMTTGSHESVGDNPPLING